MTDLLRAEGQARRQLETAETRSWVQVADAERVAHGLSDPLLFPWARPLPPSTERHTPMLQERDR